jgi:photosystem II stability/assembly factor-like uncharacterized protein
MKTIKSLSLTLIIGLMIIFLTDCKRKKKDIPTPTPSDWTSKNTGLITEVLTGDFFTDDLTGYVVGYGGVIYKTTDGFESFTALTSGTTENLIGVWFTDANTGYVVGNAGTILKTINAGATWTALTAPTSTNYTHIHFVDANIGYVTGGVGTLIKTINAGASWTVLNPGTSSDLHGIYFTDANTGYVGGQSFTLIKTTNGGTTWTPVNTDLTGGTGVTPLTSIYFTDANTGYCVGGYAYPTGTPSTDGVILKTTDGGANWFKQSHPAGTNIFGAVKFANATTGYIAGGDIANNTSTILKTTDGGGTWSIQSTSNHRLTYVFLTNSNGYAVGLDGALLKRKLLF